MPYIPYINIHLPSCLDSKISKDFRDYKYLISLAWVISMLNDPNIDSPANVDAAKEFRDNRSAWENRVKKLVLQSMDEV